MLGKITEFCDTDRKSNILIALMMEAVRPSEKSVLLERH
jgi:hypothetical protein